MMSKLKIITLVGGFISITSFAIVQKDKDQLIKERLVQRIENYKNEKLTNCYKKAMEEAEAVVDSIISIELGAGPIDTLDFPRKPQKPTFEAYDSLKQNSLPIKPLFENSQIIEK